MPITKRPPAKKASDSASVDRFISSAPDASKPEVRTGLIRGNRSQISHTLPPSMLTKVDEPEFVQREESDVVKRRLDAILTGYRKK